MVQLLGPAYISSRLLAAVNVNGATIQVEDMLVNGPDGKPCWDIIIDWPDGTEHTEEGLRGWGDANEMLATALSFLEACAESYPDGENSDLFAPKVGEWAAENSDEIALVGLELQEAIEAEK